MTRRRSTPSVVTVVAALVAGLTVGGITAATPAVAHPRPPETGIAALPLGPADLPQTSTTETLARGVTLTRIVRGAVDPEVPWVVELSIPGGGTSPDPDAPARAVQDADSADRLVADLAAAGFTAHAEPVLQPRVADVAAAVSGYRVRLSEGYPTQQAAAAATGLISTAGFTGRAWYRGWDGDAADAGRWTVNVVTIDPRRFRGELGATYGPDLERRETTTALSRLEGATAAINAGFFVLDPAAGAPGDPAGVGVYDGDLVSETVAGRPALVLDSRARHTAVVRPVWRGTVTVGHRSAALDGIDRVPGLIRNCGGVGDAPTDLPQHDVTCTDDGELVTFTPEYGASTPTGPGSEVVLDRRDRVTRVLDHRGTTLGRGESSVQATGDRVGELAGLRVGSRLEIRTGLTAGRHSLVRSGTTVINGGPQLLRAGREYITQRRDGMVHPGDPSFAYGWFLQRNPRTFAGVDAAGRTLLVTVDGRQLGELGLSIPEAAAVARVLGMREAINLDGGGSTAMAIDGALISSPSDATGERPVGDAIVVR